MHRFLVDTVDATQEMRERAHSEKDDLITDYLNDRWDAPVLKGIKGIFCLIGRSENDEAKLCSREHACFCKECMNGCFSECTHQSTTGSLKGETVMKLPYKDAPARKVPAAGDLLEKINYFKEKFTPGNNQQTIVAVPVENKHENEEPFKMAMLTKTAKQLNKDYVYECSINGSMNKITIEKGVWCITARFMETTNQSSREYIIPTKTKEIKIPVVNVYFPDNWNSSGNIFNIDFVTRSEETQNQITNYYVIGQASLDAVRLDVAADM